MNYFSNVYLEEKSFSKLQDAIDFLSSPEKKLYYKSSRTYSKILIIKDEELSDGLEHIISSFTYPHDSLYKTVFLIFKSMIGSQKCKILWKNCHNNYNVFEINQGMESKKLIDFCQHGITNGISHVKSGLCRALIK